MKKYNAALFDWDGCMARSLGVVLKAYQQTFAEYGKFPAARTITRHVFGDWNAPAKFGIADVDEFTRKHIARLDKTYSKIKLYPGVKTAFKKLKNRGLKIAVLTTSQRARVYVLLKRHRLLPYVDLLLGAEDVKYHKPHPEMLQKALAEFKIPKNESIMIGDSDKDLGAARNMKIDSLLFYPEENKVFYSLADLKTFKPTFIANNFSKIIKILTGQ